MEKELNSQNSDLFVRQAGNKPLVYSCSGCSNIAQLANDVAIKMDREGIAEMSCIAGVGACYNRKFIIIKEGVLFKLQRK